MSETKYLETHEWYIVDGESFTVGISDFAQGELGCLLYTSPSPRDRQKSRMPSSA